MLFQSQSVKEFDLTYFSVAPYLFTWVGAVCAHILSLYSDNFNGTMVFLKRMFPNRSETFYFRIDFVILPLIGTFLAIFLLEPTDIKTAIFAGLSWSGALIALLKGSGGYEKTDVESDYYFDDDEQ